MIAKTPRYFPHDRYPHITLFRCTALVADITAARCASIFRGQAQRQCQQCEIGPYHAEATDSPASERRTDGVPTPVWSKRCVRCGQAVRRLIRATICISCYNREREVMRWRNRKGTAPAHVAAKLYRGEGLVEHPHGRIEVIELSLCSGVAEVEHVIRKRYPGSVMHAIVLHPLRIFAAALGAEDSPR